MKQLSGFSIICICLILSSLTAIVTADSAHYEKSVRISLHIDNGKITTPSTEIYYGSAPNFFPTSEGFKGELVAADGSTVQTFTIWDPRVQFGDTMVMDSNVPRLQSVVDRQNSADSVIIFPFDRKVTGFRLYDSTDGTLLSSVNLQLPINSFFASYPDDPDNPVLFGSRAPIMANPPPTGIPYPDVKSSRQLWQLLVIGSGALLLLIGAFASARFMRVKPQSVLIVDDNCDILEVIGGMLRLGGYSTRTAISGEKCLKEIEYGVPDLVLLDIGMQPMDGWETLRQIKKNPVTRNIPVIMLTARKLTPKDVEDYGICIEDFVMKPLTTRDLNDAITHVFARRQMIKEKIAAVKGTGIDRNALCECVRLSRVVDVNKRLWNNLVKSYAPGDGMKGPETEITLAIKNMERKFRDQEHQLEQCQRKFGSGATG